MRADFTNRFDPLAAYLLTPDEATTDRSGNGLDLTAVGDLVPVASYVPGIAALWLDNTHYFALENAATRLLGDMSLEFVVTRGTTSAAPPNDVNALVQQAAVGETEATNFLFSAVFNGNRMEWFQEYSTGINQSVFVGSQLGGMRGFHHFLYVRASGVFSGYCDGTFLGSSAAMTPPTGGSSTKLHIGRPVDLTVTVQPLNEAMQYFALYDHALGASQASYLARLRGLAL